MVDVNWSFHPLEGIVLAAVLFALYYWIIRLRCHARKAQAFIFTAVLAVSLCSFTSLSVVLDTDKPIHANPSTPQTAQSPATASEATDGPSQPMPTAISPTDRAWSNMPLHQYSKLLIWLYAAGAAAVVISIIVQIIWYWRMRRGSILEMEDENGVSIFSTRCATPFSFFKSVFLPSRLDDDVRKYVLIHEKCHISHHHFIKLCVMLILLAVNWYNPIVWKFFSEMKMQQELEVDADVLEEGIDRHDYQMSLLKVCVQNSQWLMVQSAFSSKSLKQRILFMNKRIRNRASYLRLAASMLGLVLAFATTLALRAQISFVSAHHPLEGIWTMDFTRPANTNEELYPPFKQYAFYNHDTFFSPHFYKIDGINFFFGFSGEEVAMHDKILTNAHGEPLIYRFVSDDTFQCDWKKSSSDNSLAQGEIITDQWSRAKPSAEIMRAFHLACDADQQRQKPFDGVWHLEPSDNGGKANSFLLVNGDMLMGIDYVPDPDTSIYRYSGGGVSSEIILHNDTIEARGMKATIVLQGANRAVMQLEGNDKSTRLNRVPMPAYIHRMLATTKVSTK